MKKNPCRRYRGDIAAFLAGELSGPRAERLLAHRQSCQGCAEFLADAGQLTTLAARDVPDPGEIFWSTFPQRVFQEAHVRENRRLNTTLVLGRALVALSAILILLAGEFFRYRRNETIARHYHLYRHLPVIHNLDVLSDIMLTSEQEDSDTE